MSDPTAFIGHLRRLGARDLGGVAILRRSLSHDLGTDVRAFPYVEGQIPERHRQYEDSWERRTYYLVAGLWASVNTASILASIASEGEDSDAAAAGEAPPESANGSAPSGQRGLDRRSFGYAVAQLHRRRNKARGVEQSDAARGVERRFIALLDADEARLPHRLRQMVQLVKAEERIDIHWARMLDDLLWWNDDERRVQQRWARAFYRTISSAGATGGESAAQGTTEGA